MADEQTWVDHANRLADENATLADLLRRALSDSLDDDDWPEEAEKALAARENPHLEAING